MYKKEEDLLRHYVFTELRVEGIIKEGSEMLEELENSSKVGYVTDAADKKLIINSDDKPEYVNVPQKEYYPVWEEQSDEKDDIDAYFAKVKEFYLTDLVSRSDQKAMDAVVMDVVKYCIRKGYQGSALMYLEEMGSQPLTKQQAEFIDKSVRQVIKGYAKRTVLTGNTYAPRAIDVIIATKEGRYGFVTQNVSTSELVDEFNEHIEFVPSKRTGREVPFSVKSLEEEYRVANDVVITKDWYNNVIKARDERMKMIEGLSKN